MLIHSLPVLSEAAQPASMQCSGKHCSFARYHLFGDKVFALKIDSVLLPKHRCLL